MMEKVSCITVCRNDKNALLETMQSALQQTPPLYEVVVVDGASTDGTVALLPTLQKRFEQNGVRFQYVSEADTGIYNAMNKGVGLAEGDWLIFMNAGDCFAGTKVLEQVFSNPFPPQAGVIYGDFYKKRKKGNQYTKSRPATELGKRMIANHQAMFFARQAFAQHPYDESLRIAADYDWVLGYYMRGGTLHYVPVAVSVYEMTGLSSENGYQRFCEHMLVRGRYGVGNPPAMLAVKKCIVYLREKLRQLIE